MSELISRQEAVRILEIRLKMMMTEYQEYLEVGGNPLQEHEKWLYALNKAVEKFKHPPADQWIPCSERLPEERQKVLVTLETFTGVRFVRMDWIKDGNWWLWNSDNVTAWMPLPEPYKGVE